LTTERTVRWAELVTETAERVGDQLHARWMCEIAGGFEPRELIESLDDPVTERAVARVDAMVARRVSGEPLQYVLGSWGFRQLDLMVDQRVLIPRPETEWVVESALVEARRLLAAQRLPLHCVDLGTGSGAIALSLANELPAGDVVVWATDYSADALDVARANLAGIDSRRSPHVQLAQGSWFDALPDELRGRVDVVVANPPYIARSEAVDDSVTAWEPHEALFADGDGLDDIRRILRDAPSWLAPGGVILVEHGHQQGGATREIAASAGLTSIETRRDLADRERFVVARQPSGRSSASI
jgi:release factor glutamine methyltransferase